MVKDTREGTVRSEEHRWTAVMGRDYAQELKPGAAATIYA